MVDVLSRAQAKRGQSLNDLESSTTIGRFSSDGRSKHGSERVNLYAELGQ